MIKKGFRYRIERPYDSETDKYLPRKYYYLDMKLNENIKPDGKFNPVVNSWNN